MKRRDPTFDAFKPAHVEDGQERTDGRVGTDWINSLYHVYRIYVDDVKGYPPLWWLSIKRRDRRPIHDWRHLQRIKNDLVGPEHEAVELYPAESRLVDSANQYHLWVLADPAKRFPIGWTVRYVQSPEEAQAAGAQQRPFDEEEGAQR